jgi:aminoglycoside 6-adenylyltransferase
MRTDSEMFELILGVASRDERIRAVILNGSRVNANAPKDDFRDYDVVYFVNKIDSFTENHEWIDVFGERVILQIPDLMRLPGYEDTTNSIRFAYLMLFKDGNRIDLTLFPVDKIETDFVRDSLSALLLDKDDRFGEFPPASEDDYLIKKPSEKEFLDVCNEFWWVLPYVAKGLWRKEITYAQFYLENPVRKMFMKIIEWRIGAETDFSVNFGTAGKNLERLADSPAYEKILATYADAESENIWKAVFLMADIFDESARKIAARFGFAYNTAESTNVRKYLKDVRSLPRKSD